MDDTTWKIPVILERGNIPVQQIALTQIPTLSSSSNRVEIQESPVICLYQKFTCAQLRATLKRTYYFAFLSRGRAPRDSGAVAQATGRRWGSLFPNTEVGLRPNKNKIEIVDRSPDRREQMEEWKVRAPRTRAPFISGTPTLSTAQV